MKDAVYQVITDRVMELLEKGTVPWQKPFAGNDEMPSNLVSKKTYRGINVFLLHSMAYQSPLWLSYKQAAALGGQVRKGEKACPVVFWKQLPGETDPATGKLGRGIPLLRYYSVFNVSQCDGLEKHLPVSTTPARTSNVIDAAAAIVAAMPKAPQIKQGQSKAYYSPPGDCVSAWNSAGLSLIPCLSFLALYSH